MPVNEYSMADAQPGTLGLDIGGANLKAADCNGSVRLAPFALWKKPQQLTEELHRLIAEMPRFDLLAVTMTGELCDCYESKRQGVSAILDAVEEAADGVAIRVWRNDGQFVDVAAARETPLQVAAANWLALATFAARFGPDGPALLIDIGSTTTDIVPLQNGKPVPQGRTDPERLRSGELVYAGVRRTPVCALLGSEGAAELFATTLDVSLVLDFIAENADDRETADGRPATKAAAHARLARMMCADLETSTAEQRQRLALRIVERQVFFTSLALERVVKRMSEQPKSIVTAGSGAFLVPAILEAQPHLASASRIDLKDKIGVGASQAACAYAVAVLTREHADAFR
jgi:probable H4MPT-linked C1 transfer pathway protein